MRVAIIGTGYVGITTGVLLAYIGHDVIGVDKDAKKIEALRHGVCPIHEQGLDVLLAHVDDHLYFTESTAEAVANAHLIVIAVGTPPKTNGEADTAHVEDAAREVAGGLLPGRTYTVAIKSTVPIGSNRRVAHVIAETLRERIVEAVVHVASNPEFLREGLAVRDSFYPDRIVVGAEDGASVEPLRSLYKPILEQTFQEPPGLPRPEGYRTPPFVAMSPVSAELVKYAANAFLATKISFINEIAGLCDQVGADVSEVARCVGLDARIGSQFLSPGLGWGGSCLPKDTAALLAVGAEYGYAMPIVAAAREVNVSQRQLLVTKLQSTLKVLRGRTIGVLGLAFKPNTDDVRESPAVALVRALIERGAHVQAHDPVAMPNAAQVLKGLDVTLVTDPLAVADRADAVVVATDWNVYRDLDLADLRQRMRNPVLLDGRNLFHPIDVQRAGLEYLGVGR